MRCYYFILIGIVNSSFPSSTWINRIWNRYKNTKHLKMRMNWTFASGMRNEIRKKTAIIQENREVREWPRWMRWYWIEVKCVFVSLSRCFSLSLSPSRFPSLSMSLSLFLYFVFSIPVCVSFSSSFWLSPSLSLPHCLYFEFNILFSVSDFLAPFYSLCHFRSYLCIDMLRKLSKWR